MSRSVAAVAQEVACGSRHGSLNLGPHGQDRNSRRPTPEGPHTHFRGQERSADADALCAAFRRAAHLQEPAQAGRRRYLRPSAEPAWRLHHGRSEEHTTELQSLMRSAYAVFFLKKKTYTKHT